MKDRQYYYTRIQKAFLKKGYKKMQIAELTRTFNARFGKHKTEIQVHSCLTRWGVRCGRSGRFQKGIVPWNMGTKGCGICAPNRGTFRKGNIPGNIRPLGTERITRDGYVEVKIRERNPYTGSPTRYKLKHIMVWERSHGPLPKASAVVFKDGNRSNCCPENLVCVSRSTLVRMNQVGFGEAPPELKPSIIAAAILKTKAFELGRKLWK